MICLSIGGLIFTFSMYFACTKKEIIPQSTENPKDSVETETIRESGTVMSHQFSDDVIAVPDPQTKEEYEALSLEDKLLFMEYQNYIRNEETKSKYGWYVDDSGHVVNLADSITVFPGKWTKLKFNAQPDTMPRVIFVWYSGWMEQLKQGGGGGSQNMPSIKPVEDN